jgi:hypothetical protein
MEFAGPTIRYDPPGSGDYIGYPVSGLATPELADAASNTGRVFASIGMNAAATVVPTAVTDDDEVMTMVATTVLDAGEVILTGIAEFAPPGVRQLIIWGGKALLGLAGNIVNTQAGLLAKDKLIAAQNNINTASDCYMATDGVALTPPQCDFTPGALPTPSLPLGSIPWHLYDLLSKMPQRSVGHTMWKLMFSMISGMGIFPLFFTGLYGSATTPFDLQATQDFFIRDVGGVDCLQPTALVNGVEADDTLAGLPLYAGNGIIPRPFGSQSFIPPINMSIATYASVGSARGLLMYQAGADISSSWSGTDLLTGLGAVIGNADATRTLLLAWFGVEPVQSSAGWSVDVDATYDLMAVNETTSGSGAWRIDIARPAGVGSTGRLRLHMLFNVTGGLWVDAVNLLTRSSFTETIRRRASDNTIYPFGVGASGDAAIAFRLTLMQTH